jgi:integrase
MDNTHDTSKPDSNQVIQSLSRASAIKRQCTFALYERWAQSANIEPLPATDAGVARYVHDHVALLAHATLRHRVSVIRQTMRAAGYGWPDNDFLTRRALGEAHQHSGSRRTEPILERERNDLRAALQSSSDWKDARDLALIESGAGAGLDTLELIRLKAADVTTDEIGMAFDVGPRPWLALPHLLRALNDGPCPVRTLEVWLALRDPLPWLFYDFNELGEAVALTPVQVTTIVRRRMRQIGRDDRRFGHASLRATFLYARPMPRALAELNHESR